MGLIQAKIELTNTYDLALATAGYLRPVDVRRVEVNSLVDTGAYKLCINERVQALLGLPRIQDTQVILADGSLITVDIVGPVDVRFKNRFTTCRALVLPGDSEILLGSIPLEDLDVVLLPKEQTIDVNPESPEISRTIVKNAA